MISMTPELAEICGIHAGDGYLRIRKNGKIELDITGNLEEKNYYDNHVIILMNQFFELKLKGKAYSKGSYGFVTTNSKFKILNDLGFPFGKKSAVVKTPRVILKSKDKLIYARFLRGLLDTDGHIGFRKCYGKYKHFKAHYHNYPFISLTTISLKLAEDISFMLKELGINHFVSRYYPKKLNEKITYRIIINGVERLNLWMNLIGSENSVKFSRYLVWKKFGFCPTNLTLKQREDILNGKLDINYVGP